MLEWDRVRPSESSLILRRNAGDSQRNTGIPRVQIWVILKWRHPGAPFFVCFLFFFSRSSLIRGDGKENKTLRGSSLRRRLGSRHPQCLTHSRLGRGHNWGSGAGWGRRVGSTGRQGDLSCGRHTPFPSEPKPINSDLCENTPERAKAQTEEKTGKILTRQVKPKWNRKCSVKGSGEICQ